MQHILHKLRVIQWHSYLDDDNIPLLLNSNFRPDGHNLTIRPTESKLEHNLVSSGRGQDSMIMQK